MFSQKVEERKSERAAAHIPRGTEGDAAKTLNRDLR